MSEPNWDRAKCQGADTELFFPVSLAESVPARRICFGCEIRLDCAQWAINTGQQYGIWGGMDEKERRAAVGGRTRQTSKVALAGHRYTRALEMRSAGMRPTEIAAEMRISVDTVEKYLQMATKERAA